MCTYGATNSISLLYFKIFALHLVKWFHIQHTLVKVTTYATVGSLSLSSLSLLLLSLSFPLSLLSLCSFFFLGVHPNKTAKPAKTISVIRIH